MIESNASREEKAKVWLEEINPKCFICDPNKEKETTYHYEGSTGITPVARFVCQDCGHVALVNMNTYFENQFLNKF